MHGMCVVFWIVAWWSRKPRLATKLPKTDRTRLNLDLLVYERSHPAPESAPAGKRCDKIACASCSSNSKNSIASGDCMAEPETCVAALSAFVAGKTCADDRAMSSTRSCKLSTISVWAQYTVLCWGNPGTQTVGRTSSGSTCETEVGEEATKGFHVLACMPRASPQNILNSSAGPCSL